MDHSWVLKWVWILLYWMNLLSLKGCRCLCKDLIHLLLIRCFHEIAIRQDQHQCCTFICGALICSSVKIVSLLLRRVWHSEFGPPWQSSLSCFSKFSHTFICTIAAKLTSFFPLHQKDLFIKSSTLPQFQWQQTMFHFPPSVGFDFVLNPAECATSVDLLPLVFHCFSKRIFSLWVEFYFFCCIIVQSWLIRSSNAIFIIMKIFTVWIWPVWYQLLAISLNVSKRFLWVWLDKKGNRIDLFVYFHQHISCLLGLRCQLYFARLTIFRLFISLSAFWIDSPRLLGSIGSSFNIFFRNSTNSFRR